MSTAHICSPVLIDHVFSHIFVSHTFAVRAPTQVLELEAGNGNLDAIQEIRKEINHLRNKSEALEMEVRQKDKDIEILKQRLEESGQIYNSSGSNKIEDKLKVS